MPHRAQSALFLLGLGNASRPVLPPFASFPVQVALPTGSFNPVFNDIFSVPTAGGAQVFKNPRVPPRGSGASQGKGEAPTATCKDDEPGFIHVAIKYLPPVPRHAQANGRVERFNGRISEVLATTRFDSAQSLEETLSR